VGNVDERPRPSWWSDNPVRFSVAGSSDGVRWINPTVMPLADGSTAVFARGLRVASTLRLVHGQPVMQHVWESATAGALVPRGVPLTGQTESSPPIVLRPYIAQASQPTCARLLPCNLHNDTRTILWSTAPEDPRLFHAGGRVYLTFFAYDSGSNHSQQLEWLGTTLCNRDQHGMIGRMHLSGPIDLKRVFDRHGGALQMPATVPLKGGHEWDVDSDSAVGDARVSKNWLSFEAEDVSMERRVYWIHTIFPRHRVLISNRYPKIHVVQELPGADTRWPAHLESLLPASGPHTTAVHGSGNPMLVRAGRATRLKSYFLGTFHLVSSDPALDYATFAYAFEATAPFKVIGVSTQLWLESSDPAAACERPSSFAPGLMLRNRDAVPWVTVMYGVCDHGSRESTFPLTMLETTLMQWHDYADATRGRP
jgi:hypothetical protein